MDILFCAGSAESRPRTNQRLGHAWYHVTLNLFQGLLEMLKQVQHDPMPRAAGLL
jgi:hypothetical protein